jgi:thioredoxin
MIRKVMPLLLILILSMGVANAQDKDVKIVELTTATFKTKVWDYTKNKEFKRIGNLPIILDFHATWCRPCKMLAPHLQTIQNKYNKKLIIYKIDVDKEPELARLFNVKAMPTIVFVDKKDSYQSELGYKDYSQFEALVKDYFFKK